MESTLDGTGPPGSPQTSILIADDEDLVLDLASDVLGANGFHILCATNGKMALEVCETHDGPIELLLTDVVMPGMDGIELARHVLARRPSIQVIYMSGSADLKVIPPDRPFLRKPFRPIQLLEMVLEVLDT